MASLGGLISDRTDGVYSRVAVPQIQACWTFCTSELYTVDVSRFLVRSGPTLYEAVLELRNSLQLLKPASESDRATISRGHQLMAATTLSVTIITS
jgi:hypothetical protein